MTRNRTFTLLAALYLSQFLGVGFFVYGLVAILRDRGVSLEQLALIQTLGLIWAVKFLWAPLVDRYGSRRRGHYRGWLLVLQPLIVIGLLVMIPLDPVADFGTWLLPLAGLVVLFSATQDIAADAIAVRVLDAADRGIGNGIQGAAGYLAYMLGGGGVLIVYDAAGWAAAMIALAVLTAPPILIVWRYPEPARPVDEPRAGFGAIVSVFRAPGVARWALVVLPLLWLGVGGGYALVTPMLVDTGWSLTAIGLVTTIVAGGFAMAAAAGTGVLIRRFGRRRALLGCGALQVLTMLGLLPLAAGSREMVLAGAAVCLLNLGYAAASTVAYTVNMDLSRPGSAGTDYTVLASFAFACTLIAGAVALGLAGQVGYVPVIVGSATLLVLGLAVAARVFVDVSIRPDSEPDLDPGTGTGAPDRVSA